MHASHHSALTNRGTSPPHPLAFTIVELLVVVGIAAILAAISIPAVSTLSKRAKLMQARTEIVQLVDAIKQYEHDYAGRLPCSADAQISRVLNVPFGTSAGPLDFTFGTIDNSRKAILPGGLSKPLILVNNTVELPVFGLTPFDYQANNSEVMSVLLDEGNFHTATGLPTVNAGHLLNPKKKSFLKVPAATRPATHGINDDLVYRDPWGNPYIITLDVDRTGTCRDGLYRMAEVTQPLAPLDNGTQGYQYLSRGQVQAMVATTDHRDGARHSYMIPDSVAVWSFGPDGKANYNASNAPEQKADRGDNQDNLLSWKP